MKKVVRILVLMLISVYLCGCGEERSSQDLHDYISAVQDKSIDPIKPLPKFLFEFGKPNKKSNINKSYHKKETLAVYSASSLILVGIIMSEKQKWGLVMTPDNSVFKLQVGEKVGQEKAVVVEITNSKVVLIAQVANEKNTKTKKKINLFINPVNAI
jgi:Tfp pilus assembly protein PilP